MSFGFFGMIATALLIDPAGVIFCILPKEGCSRELFDPPPPPPMDVLSPPME